MTLYHKEYSTWGPLSTPVNLNAPAADQGDLIMSATFTPAKANVRITAVVAGTGKGNDQGGGVIITKDGALVAHAGSVPSNTFFMLTPIVVTRVTSVTVGVPVKIDVRAGPRLTGEFWIGGTWPWMNRGKQENGSGFGSGTNVCTLDIEEIDLGSANDPALSIVAAMGQSNIDGHADYTQFPVFPRRDRVRRFEVTNGWGPAFEPWNHDGPLYPVLNEAPSVSQGGPILSFADRLVQVSGNDVGVVASTKAGIGINAWGRNLSPLTLYGAFLDRTQKALASAPAGSSLRGVISYIGEADADTSANASAWGTRYLQFVSDVRSDLGLPNLPFVYAIIGPDPQSPAWPYWGTVQSVQANLSLPSKVARVDLRDLTGAGHLDAASIVTAGRRFADALNAL